MTGEPAKNFHGVGIGPRSKILAVKFLQSERSSVSYLEVLLGNRVKIQNTRLLF